MRTVEIKNLDTDKVVCRGHFWSFEQVKEQANLGPGRYAIQGTNSMACNPRISRQQWAKAETFEVLG